MIKRTGTILFKKINKISGKTVEIFTVDGRRVPAQTGHRLRGVYILCDARKTSKVVYP